MKPKYNLVFEYGEKNRPKITHSKNVYQEMKDIKYEKKEFLICFHLDTTKKIILREVVAIGDLSNCIVHPREVFRSAVIRSAAAIILAHNHPSGDPTPSVEDKDITKRIIEAGKILGIPLLDHIVVGKNNYIALKEEEAHLWCD